MQPRAVILAAGRSSRMGRPKALLPFRGRPMIEYAIDAAREFRPLVVASPAVMQHLAKRGEVCTILNDEPERGMTYSVALADAKIPEDVPIAVLLADKPLVTASLITELCDIAAAAGADVVYPQHPETGEPGHPVIFSPRARKKIRSLPEGDTLKLLREDASLERRVLVTADRGAYFDIDTPEQLEL